MSERRQKALAPPSSPSEAFHRAVLREICARLDDLQKQADDLAAQAKELHNDANFLLDDYLDSPVDNIIRPSQANPVTLSNKKSVAPAQSDDDG